METFKTKTKTQMKKTIAILAIAAVVYACSGAKNTDAVDSAAVGIDSVAVQADGPSGGEGVVKENAQNIK